MLQGRDILCVSSIDWDFIWQGHQEIMSRLAAAGNRVLFIENTGVRPPTVRDLPRLRHRIRNWRRSTRGFREERRNLFVYSPLVLPFPYSRFAQLLNRAFLLRPIRQWMRATRFNPAVAWTFLPTPFARALIRELSPTVTVYYCIDDFASSSPAARRIAQSENQVLREADLVFVTSSKLRERAAQFSDCVHLFPFAVDYRAFERVRTANDPLPAEFDGLSHPVVGYIGGLHQWIDQDLLVDVATRLPHASFVLVGPAQTDVSRLAARPNVRLLGARPHPDVPRYVKGFDVGVVPYLRSEYTDNVYPTKLNEYLALGIPVVATDLPEIQRFNAEHGPVVTVASDAASFAELIVNAADNHSRAAVERRVAVAAANGWDARLERMSVLIEDLLRAREMNATAWEQRFRRLYRAARRRSVWTIVPVASAVLFLCLLLYTPLLWRLAEPLRLADAPRPVDAIVVFAAGVGESGRAGGGYQERVKHAADLYRQGLAPRMIFSSGYVFAFREAEIMRDLAITVGVPHDAIVLETASRNTYDNVRLVQRILTRNGWRRILLVSSPYHMRRAVLTWRRADSQVAVISSPVPGSQFYAHERGASLEQIEGIAREYVALLVYWWKGWI